MKGLLFITHKNERFGYLDTVKIAIDGGCKQIQLRMKDSSVEEVAQTAITAKKLCDNAGVDLYIDDHPHICRLVGARGVHLGKLDMSPERARDVVDAGQLIGGTANTFDDIARLHSQGVDYIGLGPFRFTTTKKNLSPVLGVEGYRDILDRCHAEGISLPVVAIGGITADDIEMLLGAGVSAIALSSTILAADDPVHETRRIIDIIDYCDRQA